MQAAAPASSVAGANACRQTSTCLPCSTRAARTASTRRRPPAWKTSPTAPPSPCAISPTRPWRCSATVSARRWPTKPPGKRRRAVAPPVRLRPSGTAPATRRRIAPRRRGGAAGGRPPPGWRQRATRGRRPARAVPADPARRLPGDRDRRAQPIALACALDVLLGEHDEEVSAAEAQAWSDASRTPARLRRFPGGHFYLSEGRDAVIEHLLRRLAHPDALSREVA